VDVLGRMKQWMTTHPDDASTARFFELWPEHMAAFPPGCSEYWTVAEQPEIMTWEDGPVRGLPRRSFDTTNVVNCALTSTSALVFARRSRCTDYMGVGAVSCFRANRGYL